MIKKEEIVEKSKKLVTFLQDFGFTFADCNKMLRNKDVKVNGKAQKENIVLNAGDSVVFYFSKDMLEKKYEKVFESEDAVIVYKSAGIECVGQIEESLKAVAVHRLDRNTEGLLVYAKTEKSEKNLKKAFKNGKIHKFYLAEVIGEFDVDKTFDAYLVKNAENSFVQIFDKKVAGSVKISTKIKTIYAKKETSLLEVELLTGKTHQIRAHLAHLGHPIVGDGKYGKNADNKKFGFSRQKLAAYKLEFDDVEIPSLNNKKFKKYPKWANI